MTFPTLPKAAIALLRQSRKLWVRVAILAALAVASAAASVALEDLIPQSVQQRFSPDAVLPILTILASGMLAVSTFSLNVMVTAHNAAAGQTTPRVHGILLADPTTQTTLATFIGAFVYALSAIILFKAGFYPEGASVLVLGVTVGVVVLVIIALLRWINHLSDLGSLDATLRSVEAVTRKTLLRTRELPAFGAHPLTADMVIPQAASPLHAPRTGHVQVIDLSSLDTLLTDEAARLYLYVRPGDYIVKGEVIGHVSGMHGANAPDPTGCLIIGPERSFEQDATFGLLVLSETASRALSPGINDPGTAIAVICVLEKLLLDWASTRQRDDVPMFTRLFLPDNSRVAMIEDAFAGTARDGAGTIEVAMRLQQALHRLEQSADAALAEAAGKMAALALDYADDALILNSEKDRMRARKARFWPAP